MVGENKILTVSYGTFSCTLEGFDDPFSTMKAIAEYFRDLAAEDRFFGAEPPQPDTDMLHRIAEQTVQSRVAAEVTDNSLVLRQDHSAAAAPLAAAAMAQPAPEAAPQPAPAPVAEPVASNAMAGDSIAAKLQRIRSVVAQEAQVTDETASFYSEDEHADGFAQAPSDEAASEPVDEPADIHVAETRIAASNDEMEVSSAAEPEFEPAPQPEMSDTPDSESAETAAESDASDDTPDAVATQADLSDEDSSEDVLSTETLSEDAISDDVELDEDTLAGALDALDEAEAETASDSLETQADEDVAEEPADNIFEEAAPRRRVVVQKISREDVEAAQNGTPEVSETADLSEEAEAALMAELADVEADIEDAIAEETVSEDAADASEEVVADNVEEEAAVSSEQVDDTSEDSAEDSADAADKAEIEDAELASDEADKEEARAERKARRSLLLETEDAALNRLMDATRSKMSDDDEGAVRRASIAHLKAAVAATKADDSIVQAAAKEEERELDQYRDDLARVVRPVRSRAIEGADGETRPSTLMLVSEQRIEKPSEDAPQAAEPDVRPRRVASTAGNLALNEQFEEEEDGALPTGATESFTAFAQRYQAMELPDLLEAAAAYFSYVEDVKEFTRPMLMRKIATLTTGETPSREDGLRCFGALLRDNKIIRSGNGKFTLSETNRFASEARNDAD